MKIISRLEFEKMWETAHPRSWSVDFMSFALTFFLAVLFCTTGVCVGDTFFHNIKIGIGVIGIPGSIGAALAGKKIARG